MPSVIGRSVGKVASRIGRNSLQEEFWRELEERRLPRTDAPEDFTLKPGDPVQVEASIFLHRLRVADIPYAAYRGTQPAGVRTCPAPTEEAGGYAALSRVKEAWQARWTPSTDVALVERIVCSLATLLAAQWDAIAAAASSASGWPRRGVLCGTSLFVMRLTPVASTSRGSGTAPTAPGWHR